jgi:single-stranded DNA-binding protein
VASTTARAWVLADEGHTLRALQGRLGADVELRRSASGWCRLSVGVGEGDDVTWVSVAVFEEKVRTLAGIAKGVEVYVEGRLSLNAWIGYDGEKRTGLVVAAWQVMPFGQIGRRKGVALILSPQWTVRLGNSTTFSGISTVCL